MDPVRVLAGARKLLQTNETTPTYHTSIPDQCKGAACLLFHMLTIVVILCVLLFIIFLVWYAKFKVNQAIRKGRVPAKLLYSYWTIPQAERGDIDAFAFPLHQPNSRADINEESCPICLKDRPKHKDWVVFEGCRHATCLKCFKKLVGQYRLHAACPMCRALLAVGEGDRGGEPKPNASTAPPAVVPTTEVLAAGEQAAVVLVAEAPAAGEQRAEVHVAEVQAAEVQAAEVEAAAQGTNGQVAGNSRA